ncbi:hypothetical protein GCM10010954_05250 [Halobacillus andaensis]|uniref:Uncharacterized protein n=1 Tax=Halobacillus andaensis TaxID=1176239 RepID=A0A917EUW4_HALAA|nr:hypothetical protein [Halobacillus andaensis]MBP2003314.1 hypothetical protein [Halobacillus andaensis]GGF09732.1 hypothetical protein GCM10010954_05250 [Halobacillus andaensis]
MLEENMDEADLTNANKLFDEFQQQMDKIFEDADLRPTNLKNEFS